jgi:hypothetical protein
LAAAALAVGIFIFDTISPLQFAVAVLYVVVVFMAATYRQRRGVVLAAGACSILTVLSYLLAHGLTLEGTAPDRSLVSLAAIGITTFLALKYITAQERLLSAERHRANLARFFSDIGSDKQLELTVLGDTVNIASRVEGCCRPLDAAVLVTRAMVDALHSEGSDVLATRFADQGQHLLRGRAEPVQLYGVRRSALHRA